MKAFKAIFLSLLLVTSCGASPPHKPDTNRYYSATDMNSCGRQGYLPWCNANRIITLDEKMVKWDYAARRKFTYKLDSDQYKAIDDWRSHADEVLTNKSWSDDCDGLAETIVDLMIRDGYPPEMIYRVMVKSPGAKEVDHFIAIVHSPSGWYVVGDTFSDGVYKLSSTPHTIVMVSKVTDGIFFTKVENSKIWIANPK
jgi:hypothetical protein